MSDKKILPEDTELLELAVRPCSYPDCKRPHDRKGYCQAHAWQLKHKGVLTPVQERSYNRATKVECAVPGCKNLQVGAHIVCTTHQSISRGYSLSHSDYVNMYNLGCQICKRTDVPLSVDHDHNCCSEPKKSCGKCIRGMICSDDNFLLGWIDRSKVPLNTLLSNIAWYYEYDEVVRGIHV